MCGIFLYIQQLLNKNAAARNSEVNAIFEKFNALAHRGPEASVFKSFLRKEQDEQINLGFHRLKIIGTKGEFGMQPFYNHSLNTYLLMNGEIYNYQEILNELKEKHLIPQKYKIKSDCEIILLLYKFLSIEIIVKKIRGEYAFILLDLNKNKIFMARDELGIRPLFYNISNTDISISSEYKGIVNTNTTTTCAQVEPATIYSINLFDYNIVKKQVYYDITSIKSYYKFSYLSLIKQKLINAVQIRLNAERPLGFLLSGGFDSSLILSIATNLIVNNNMQKLLPINAFSIKYTGENDLTDDNDDIIHAKSVVKFLNNKYFKIFNKNIIIHDIVLFNKKQGLDAIPEVIYYLESWDQTTIRASTPMFLLVKHIKEKTDIKVLFSGEVADELFFSYLYCNYAPNANEFDKECRTLLTNLYHYDVLRADRIISSQGLEVRVPFSDREFMTEYLSTKLKFRYTPDKIEKYLIREVFKNNYLPENTRLRRKDAFSNSINSNKADWIADIKKKCNDENLSENEYYLNIFKNYNYPLNIIPKYWLPRQDWINTNGESSATILSVY